MTNPDMRNMPDHHPERGDQIEAWLEDRRNQWHSPGAGQNQASAGHQISYQAIDALLEEYRLAADTMMSLQNVVNGEPEQEPLDRPLKKKPARKTVTKKKS